MMIRRKSSFAFSAAALLLTLLASPAISEVISVEFSGEMFFAPQNDSDGFFARAGVVNGDRVAGQFTYDTETPSSNTSTGLSQYYPVPNDYSFTIGGNKVHFEWNGGGSGIAIRDNFSSIGDMFTKSYSGNLVNSTTGETSALNSTNSWIADNTGTTWSGTALPTLNVLRNLIDPATNLGYQSFSRMQGTFLDFRVLNFTMTANLGSLDQSNEPLPVNCSTTLGATTINPPAFAQTVTVGISGALAVIDFSIQRPTDYDAGDVILEIRNVESGVPGSVILGSKTFSPSELLAFPTDSSGFASFDVSDLGISLTAGEQIAIVWTRNAYFGTGGKNLIFYCSGGAVGDPDGLYVGGGAFTSPDQAATWTSFNSWIDFRFRTYVIPQSQSDSDNDGVGDGADLCPFTGTGAAVDANGCSDSQVDTDADGVCDSGAASNGPSGCVGSDNCPLDSNPFQQDSDSDGPGDACDSDDDNDGVLDGEDNCPLTLGGNADQTDTDGDLAGDICDADLDGDGVDNVGDVCPNDPDPDQTDTDGDLAGDACDANDDGDYFVDVEDNCPLDVNNGQEDLDGDNIGDACDADLDGDSVDNVNDNCPITLGGNADQTDTDADGAGDVCDADDDNDSVLDGVDNCPLAANTSQNDTDGDGIGDACNDADDADGDEWSDGLDNCPNLANGNQADFDGDLVGDACDSDIDGDGVDNSADDCGWTPLGELSDASGCTIAQLCPCDGPSGTTKPWKNHGKYVSCTAHAANDFVSAGLITEIDKDAIVSAAGQSSCGKK